MEFALADARLNPRMLHINAHGTSTPLGDAAEVSAVKELGDHAHALAMSSTKSMTGHTLGAAGGLESIAVIKALQHGVLPPTINLDNPDEGFDLDFVANEGVGARCQDRPEQLVRIRWPQCLAGVCPLRRMSSRDAEMTIGRANTADRPVLSCGPCSERHAESGVDQDTVPAGVVRIQAGI